tara:strand:+ start:3006 stop:3599 length:594 start_codon:yes stop_codon:yes gene_type:complete
MNNFIILSISISFVLGLSNILDESNILGKQKKEPNNMKAYGSIDFGDSKQYVTSKFKENEIFTDLDNNIYFIYLFDTPFQIEFIYGTNERKPTFLKTIRLKLQSIVDSYVIDKIIESFNEKYGPSDKYYINLDGNIRDYYKWLHIDKIIHLDFDGIDIDITINSKHFNKLSKSSIEEDIENRYKKKLERFENQMNKL